MVGEASHVEFVDHGLCVGYAQRPVAFPVIMTGIGDYALQAGGDIVARFAGRFPVVIPRIEGACIRIRKDLVTIVPIAACRVVRAVYPIAIDLAGADARYKAMPVVERPVRLRIERYNARPFVIRVVKEEKFHALAALRKEAEIDPIRADGGPDGEALTGENINRFSIHLKDPIPSHTEL